MGFVNYRVLSRCLRVYPAGKSSLCSRVIVSVYSPGYTELGVVTAS